MRSVDDSEKGSDDGRMSHRQHESIYFLVAVRSSVLLQTDGPLVKLDRGVPVARKLLVQICYQEYRKYRKRNIKLL